MMVYLIVVQLLISNVEEWSCLAQCIVFMLYSVHNTSWHLLNVISVPTPIWILCCEVPGQSNLLPVPKVISTYTNCILMYWQWPWNLFVYVLVCIWIYIYEKLFDYLMFYAETVCLPNCLLKSYHSFRMCLYLVCFFSPAETGPSLLYNTPQPNFNLLYMCPCTSR